MCKRKSWMISVIVSCSSLLFIPVLTHANDVPSPKLAIAKSIQSKPGDLYIWGASTARDILAMPEEYRHNVKEIVASRLSGVLALDLQGTARLWSTSWSQPDIIRDNVVQIAASKSGLVMLSASGELTGSEHVDIPESARTNIIKVAGSESTPVMLALTRDGEVIDINRDDRIQSEVPDTAKVDVVDIFVGHHNFFALKKDGQVVVWGNNAERIPKEKLTDVKQITESVSGGMLMKNDGTLSGWRYHNDSGDEFLVNIPDAAHGDIKQLSVNESFALVLKNNGEVIAWGNNDGGSVLSGPSTLTLPVSFLFTSSDSFVSMAIQGQGEAIKRLPAPVLTYPAEGSHNSLPSEFVFEGKTNAPKIVGVEILDLGNDKDSTMDDRSYEKRPFKVDMQTREWRSDTLLGTDEKPANKIWENGERRIQLTGITADGRRTLASQATFLVSQPSEGGVVLAGSDTVTSNDANAGIPVRYHSPKDKNVYLFSQYYDPEKRVWATFGDYRKDIPRGTVGETTIKVNKTWHPQGGLFRIGLSEFDSKGEANASTVNLAGEAQPVTVMP